MSPLTLCACPEHAHSFSYICSSFHIFVGLFFEKRFADNEPFDLMRCPEHMTHTHTHTHTHTQTCAQGKLRKKYCSFYVCMIYVCMYESFIYTYVYMYVYVYIYINEERSTNWWTYLSLRTRATSKVALLLLSPSTTPVQKKNCKFTSGVVYKKD